MKSMVNDLDAFEAAAKAATPTPEGHPLADEYVVWCRTGASRGRGPASGTIYDARALAFMQRDGAALCAELRTLRAGAHEAALAKVEAAEARRERGALTNLLRELRDVGRELRDVGVGKIRHVYAGTCPEVWPGGDGSPTDRADPLDECPACEILRRADSLLYGEPEPPSPGAGASPMDVSDPLDIGHPDPPSPG